MNSENSPSKSQRFSEPSLLPFQERVTAEVEDFRRRMRMTFIINLILSAALVVGFSLLAFIRYGRASADLDSAKEAAKFLQAQSAGLSALLDELNNKSQKLTADLEEANAMGRTQLKEMEAAFADLTNRFWKEQSLPLEQLATQLAKVATAQKSVSQTPEDLSRAGGNPQPSANAFDTKLLSAELDRLARAATNKDLEQIHQSLNRLRLLLVPGSQPSK